MQTDIVLYHKGKKLIIDAKYYKNMYQKNKLYNKETFKSNHLYQIFTYVKNEDKEEQGNVYGMLLYVKTMQNDKIWVPYNFYNNQVIVAIFDMSKDFEYVKRQLDDIAKWFKSLES